MPYSLLYHIRAESGTIGVEQTSDNGAAGREPQAARPLKTKQRLPMRTPRTKNKGISG